MMNKLLESHQISYQPESPEMRKVMDEQVKLWQDVYPQIKAGNRDSMLKKMYRIESGKERKWDTFGINGFVTEISKKFKDKTMSFRTDGFIKRYQRWQCTEKPDSKQVASVVCRMMGILGVKGKTRYTKDKVFVKFD